LIKTKLDFSIQSFEDIQVGQSATIEFIIKAEDIDSFAKLSGDFNPLHMDEQFARRTRYRERIAHGMLTCSPISALVGMCLPGKNAILLSQQVRFINPAKIGDALSIYGEVKAKSSATHAIVVAFKILNKQSGQLVANGEVQVLVADPPRIGVTMEDIKDMNLKIDFSDNVILVTGASRGIGEATAKLFAYHGGRVVVNYFRGQEDAERVVQEITSSGGEAISIRADVRNKEEVDLMVKKAVDKFGKVDILVNNAVGDAVPMDFAKTTWQDMQGDLDVIVKGAFNCIQAVIPVMLSGGFGRIINVCTTYINSPPSRYCKYVVAKSALLGLTRALAVEYGGKNILVNAVSPSFADTDLTAHVPEHIKAGIAKQVPVGRIAEPIDVAKAIVFLVSEYANYINGHELVVNGGGNV